MLRVRMKHLLLVIPTPAPSEGRHFLLLGSYSEEKFDESVTIACIFSASQDEAQDYDD